MYITINKEWFEKNKVKFSDAAVKEHNSSDDYFINFNSTPELMELDKGELHLSERKGEDIYVSMDYSPDTDVIVSLVEESIDDIKGDALVKIIELVVKKLNKFKSLIESIRGL